MLLGKAAKQAGVQLESLLLGFAERLIRSVADWWLSTRLGLAVQGLSRIRLGDAFWGSSRFIGHKRPLD